MMKTAVEDPLSAPIPIVVYEKPTTEADATFNTEAFSDEARALNTELPAEGSGFRTIELFPRIVRCHGWLDFDTNLLFNLDRRVRISVIPRGKTINKHLRMFEPDQVHHAIVYEFVEDGGNDENTVRDVAAFLHMIGFSYDGAPLTTNWRNGVLVDHSDIVHPGGSGWRESHYKLTDYPLALVRGES